MARKESTDLTPRDESANSMSIPGTFMPADFEDFLSQGGFAQIDTVMIGEDEGKIPMYLGRLLGPGAEVEVQAPDGTENHLPTWSFHPLAKSSSGIGVVENVTHIIPAAHQLHGALSRIYAHVQQTGKIATVGIMTNGRVQTKRGRQLNTFRVFEKYDDATK
jgi:hypothetical protein